jgi:nucleotide-binding universal stress UspA family protein
MFHDILVAIDGSPEAELALTQAIDLAESEHTRLTLIAGVQKPASVAYIGLVGVPLEELDADPRSWAEAVLRRACDRVPDDLPVTTVMTDEPIRTALIDQVQRGGHDLIVMGSRGRGAVRAAVLGSVSHYVLNHSPVPVLIVQPNPDAAPVLGRPEFRRRAIPDHKARGRIASPEERSTPRRLGGRMSTSHRRTGRDPTA